tara:strand:- start:5783 stop:7120 length:1338 start_codon:yes stop_codon:yes gene_type:complete
MGYTNSEVVNRYMNKKRNRAGNVAGQSSNGNISYDGDRLYSYNQVIAERLETGGYWFNTATYSVTTNQHQNLLRSAIPHKEMIDCPEDALDQALNWCNVNGYAKSSRLQLIDKAPDQWVVTIGDAVVKTISPRFDHDGYSYDVTMSRRQPIDSPIHRTSDIEWFYQLDGLVRVSHLMGGALFRIKHHKGKYSYMLCGVDETGKRGMGFFLVKLPRKATNIEQAYDLMRPDEVPKGYESMDGWHRQGEFYFHDEGVTTSDIIGMGVKVADNVSTKRELVPVGEDERVLLHNMDDYEDRVAWCNDAVAHTITNGWLMQNRPADCLCQRKDLPSYSAWYNYDPDEWVSIDSWERMTAVGVHLERTTRSRIHKRVDLSGELAFGNGGNPHTATDCMITNDGAIYVRKTIKHPEHRMVSLGNTWHRVYINRINQTASTRGATWNTRGGID